MYITYMNQLTIDGSNGRFCINKLYYMCLSAKRRIQTQEDSYRELEQKSEILTITKQTTL